jgi:hypothetical protein
MYYRTSAQWLAPTGRCNGFIYNERVKCPGLIVPTAWLGTVTYTTTVSAASSPADLIASDAGTGGDKGS